MLEALRSANPAEVEALCRVYIVEGPPALFAASPLEYEFLRTRIAGTLGVHPHSVGLVGSTRVGYSLSPRKLFAPIRPNSDLDFYLVDNDLYRRCIEEIEQWQADADAGRITARSATQQSAWSRIFKGLARWSRYGFVDSKHLLENDRYPTLHRVRRTDRSVERDLKTLGQHRPVSTRIYATWDRFYAVNRENLTVIAKGQATSP